MSYHKEFVNSEGEKISITEVTNAPKFKNMCVLELHDDAPSTVVAIHLLDFDTIEWLIDHLTRIQLVNLINKDVADDRKVSFADSQFTNRSD